MGFTYTSTLGAGIQVTSWKSTEGKDVFLCFGTSGPFWDLALNAEALCVYSCTEFP